MKNPILSFLVAIGLVTYGSYHVYHGLYDMHEAKASRQWPAAEGTIQSHDIDSHTTKSQTYYEPIVKYSYVAENEEFTETRIAWYTRTFSSQDDANEYLKHSFPIGSHVPVYYDPSHPHHACLIRGGSSRAEVDVFAGSMMIGITLLIFGVGFVRRVMQGPFG